MDDTTPEPDAAPAPTRPSTRRLRAAASKPRQAVILIHGIGEQRPMTTLRSFVDAVLDQKDSDSQADAKYYSKPDYLSDNLELRRLVSAGGRGPRTSFYEFYWAHLMPTAPWDRLVSWFWMLVYRRPNEVPRPLAAIWFLSWAALVAALALGVWGAIRFATGAPVAAGAAASLPWLLAGILGLAATSLRSRIGDAAVYLNPSPRNIKARQSIRATGLELLDRLANSGRYDRIIVVGHSLGSVIGYDVLTFAWQRHLDAERRRMSLAWKRGEYPDIESAALREAEALAKRMRAEQTASPPDTSDHADEWQRATRSVAAEQRRNGSRWLVTDFVTLGSPLTYGDLLLANNRRDFERRARERELPHCPPVRELSGRFSYPHNDTDDRGRPQHAHILNNAAVFAATLWTNIYFPARHLFKGDIVGGPIAPLFWTGVRDVQVATRTWGGWLAHTRYWHRDPRNADPTTNPVNALRAALDLGRTRMGDTAVAPARNPDLEEKPHGA